MPKRQKIRRYASIYSSNGGNNTFVMITMVVVIGVLAFIGWSVYTPFYNFLISISEDHVSVSSSDTPALTPSQVEVSQNHPKEPEKIQQQLKAVYAPHSIVSDASQFEEFLKGLRGTGINAIMIDGKNAQGEILYRSQVEMATLNSLVVPNAFDAKTLVSKIKNEGYTPMVKINAFRDPLGARADRKAAVSYMGSDFSWLDNSPELGGRPWLNPYSVTATDYIKNIADELSKSGFEHIIVESVQFPSGVGLEKADFKASSPPKLDVLSNFVKQLSDIVSQNNTVISVYLPSTSFVQDSSMLYGGDPIIIADKAGSAVVDMISTNYQNGATIGNTVLDNPQVDYAKTVSAVSDFISLKETPQYAVLSAVSSNGTVLGLSAIDEQIKALNSNIDGYILYSSNGKYGLKQ